VTRRRVREAVRDAPAPSALVADTRRVDESATPTTENPVVPTGGTDPTEVPAPRPPQGASATVPAQPAGQGAGPAEVEPDAESTSVEQGAASAPVDERAVPAPVEEHPAPAPGGGGALDPTAVPLVLPEEPDVDDVRWDGPVPPSQVVRTPVARRAVPRVAPPPDDVAATGPVPPVEPADPARPAAADPLAAAPVGRSTAHVPVADPARSSGPPWTVRGPGLPASAVPGAAGSGATPVVPAPGAPSDAATSDAAPSSGGSVDGRARVPAADDAPVLPTPAAEGAVGESGLPTLDDLLASRPRPAQGPAELGWRAVVRRATGGLLALPPGPDEQRVRESVAAVQRPLDGPRTVVVINPKGGAHKTTATLLLAATFGAYRGRSTLAWDNNETRGTLGWRSQHDDHQRTAVDLLDDLHRFDDPAARVGDLDPYVRPQSAQFDVLASDEDAASAASIDAFAFRALHRTLQRFYRVLVVDTGNNMRASNWQAAIEAADQVVVVSTVREDTSQSAAWALDALRAAGKEDVVRRAVTVLSDPATRRDAALHQRLHDHFGRLTRVVLDVPYDASLVAGGPLDVEALSRQTREAWLHVAAAVADGL
jgi:MinD-like ATPase involved in chromosome partitioning or flagellar assembly